mmetsp:Transcript_2535/g.5835  ORF Transcript_2535/g.5835 Transcript_2535/m.5835 type:complete len:87 (+) Transcript_2535:679-939(+)
MLQHLAPASKMARPDVCLIATGTVCTAASVDAELFRNVVARAGTGVLEVDVDVDMEVCACSAGAARTEEPASLLGALQTEAVAVLL